MAKGKKLITLFLVFSFIAISANLYAEEKGADIVVQKKDGQQTKGELIAVKKNSLLLLDSEGTDVTVDVNDIKVVRIVRKSKAGKGTLYGFFTGVSIGVLSGYSSDPDAAPGRTESAVIGGIAFGLIGALMGTIAGALAGKDSTIQIEGMSDSEAKEVFEKLRNKARIQNYQ